MEFTIPIRRIVTSSVRDITVDATTLDEAIRKALAQSEYTDFSCDSIEYEYLPDKL